MNRIVPVELCHLGFELRQHLRGPLQLGKTGLVFTDPRSHRRHTRLRLCQRELHLLEHWVRVERSKLPRPGLAARFDLFELLLLKLFDDPARANHIRMLFGVALHHVIEIALERIDPAIDLRNRYVRGIRCLRQ
jgi:hypothetical protein